MLNKKLLQHELIFILSCQLEAIRPCSWTGIKSNPKQSMNQRLTRLNCTSLYWTLDVLLKHCVTEASSNEPLFELLVSKLQQNLKGLHSRVYVDGYFWTWCCLHGESSQNEKKIIVVGIFWWPPTICWNIFMICWMHLNEEVQVEVLRAEELRLEMLLSCWLTPTTSSHFEDLILIFTRFFWHQVTNCFCRSSSTLPTVSNSVTTVHNNNGRAH